MTALTAGTSKTFTLRDTGSVTISTSGGIASVLATPTGGTAQTTILGPTPSRLVVGPFAEGATVVVTNQSATLDYDQPYGSLVTLNDAGTALVSGDGDITPMSKARPRRYIAIGDSFFYIGGNYDYPWTLTPTGSIGGAIPLGGQQLIGSGTYTLTINANLAANFNGGATTTLQSGLNLIPGATGVYDGIGVTINRADLVAGSMTVARSGSRADEFFGAANPLNWAQIFAGQSIEFDNYGASSLKLQSMAVDGLAYLISSGAVAAAAGIVLSMGTNDVNAGRTLAQMQADFASVVDPLIATHMPLYLLPQPPYRTGWSAGQRTIMAQFNAWMRAYVKGAASVIYVNCYATMSPETGTTLRYSPDSIHPGDPAGQYAGYLLWQAMGSPYADIFTPSADTSSFSQSIPDANYMATEYLVGDSSGMPTTPAMSASATSATPTWTRVNRTDGIAGQWLQVVYSTAADGGSATASTVATLPAPSGGYPPNYARMQAYAEVDCSGVTLAPDIRLSILRSGTPNRYGRATVQTLLTTTLPITTFKGVLRSAPTLIVPTDDGLGLFLQGFGINGASSQQVRFGRVMVNQFSP